MNNSHILVRRNRQVNREKPPPRICPRCNSDNIRFCYYNNYSPRYTCKNCRRLWTHGGTLRNISAGGSRIDQTSVAQVVPVETQQVNHHQPFLHGQETNDFLGSIGGSSSSAAVVGNHFGSLPETHGDMVFPFRSYPPMNRPVFNDGSFPQGYYHVGHVNNHNSYRVNQEDPNKPRQRFNNTMSMNHNTSTSGS
ncbi:LOW QUALITY PROTEIN: hypothetical protein BRARA_H01051 [Brassica rapa]|uniref:Dof zinc finger protein n=1 Tax=Brassica campestris TaxID=3711 RepID=A0A397YK51_BRACM|nr:LOW QUALITY PROTEIN: hypothetical protein BRARA_H01051 [Brassica rapa]